MTFTDVPIELVKEYWDRRPCNIRHSPFRIGTKKYFDEVEARKYFVEPHIPKFAEFERWKGKKVLEIGCGIGTDTINFARHGAFVTAVDISEKSIEIAKQRARIYGFEDRIRFILADAENLSSTIKPEPYDLIYSFGVIHHTPNPGQIIKQIAENFVGHGSVIKIMVYNRFSWKVFQIIFTGGFKSWFKKDEYIARYSEAQTGCPITHAYSPRQLKKLLNSAFKIIDIKIEHIFPYQVSEYKEYRYNKKLLWRIMPKKIFNYLEHVLGWHLCVTALANKPQSNQ